MFPKLITALTISFQAQGNMTVEPVTYSRYDVGYNFEEEMEARMVMSKEVQEFGFLETDVLALIVPDGKAEEKIMAYLRKAWTVIPSIMIYPNEI